jgi:hypothetical protein
VPGGLIHLTAVESRASEGEVVRDLGVGFHESRQYGQRADLSVLAFAQYCAKD